MYIPSSNALLSRWDAFPQSAKPEPKSDDAKAQMAVGLAAVQLVGLYLSGRHFDKQLKRAENMANFRERMAKESGARQVQAHRGKVKAVISQQRVGYASQNVLVSEGSAAELQAATSEIGEREAEEIRNNALYAGLGHQAAATNTSIDIMQARDKRLGDTMTQTGMYMYAAFKKDDDGDGDGTAWWER